MTKTALFVNGRQVEIEAAPSTPLLWVVRDILRLTATKYGCGKGLCGACTVHVDGQALRSCSVPLASVEGRSVTTLEGLSESAASLHPVQQAWLEEKVPQCGYCQPGFMMAAAALLQRFSDPADEDIKTHITNLCRCGTHPRIIKAIRRAATLQQAQKPG